MFGSLKNLRNGRRALGFFCALAWLSGCGAMLGGPSGNSRSGGSPFGDQSQSTGSSSSGSTATRQTGGGTTGTYTGYSQELQVCDHYRAAAQSIVNPCGSVFQQNLDELSSGCRGKFQDLYNTDCNGLKDRLSSVFNACGSDLSQALAAHVLPSNCESALRKFVK